MTETLHARTLVHAVAIAETFLIPHALAAFAELGADPAVEDARRVLQWIERHKHAQFTRRDAHQALRATIRRPADLDPTLRLLVEHGIIREAAMPARSGPGRSPSPLFEVNPLWAPEFV